MEAVEDPLDMNTQREPQSPKELSAAESDDMSQITGFDLSELLPYSLQAAFNSEDRQNDPFCLPNTRADIIDRISSWAERENETPTFWLSGAAGVGKTTIARTIARNFHDHGRLGASFFFRANGDISNASKLFTTIAIQLAEQQPSLKRYIRDAIEECSDIMSQGLREQWKQLIYQPLAKMYGPPQQPLIVVIDALDTCSAEDDVRAVIGIFDEAFGLKTIPLKILITCRPEILERYDVRGILDAQTFTLNICELVPSVADNDISAFIKQTFEPLRAQYSYKEDWPGQDGLEELTRSSKGSFLWAATACRFISGLAPDNSLQLPEDRLPLVIQAGSFISSEDRRFDSLYATILENLGYRAKGGEESIKLYTNSASLLEALVTLLSTLSLNSLSKLLGIPKADMEVVLSSLSSVIQVTEDQASPVSFYHSSFREFLLEKSGYNTEHFQIDQQVSHRMLAKSCLRILCEALKKDMRNSREPRIPPSNLTVDWDNGCVPQHLQYACENWVQHLQKGGIDDNTHDTILEFLQQHFLHWLEAMSLIGKVSQAVSAISLLQRITVSQATELIAFVRDANRFVSFFEKMIEEAPLQVYCSALLFAPEKSLIRKRFQDQVPSWIESLPRVSEAWTPLTKTLGGHTSFVGCITFSSDGLIIATGSFDNTVKLWDALDGVQLRTLKGHTESVAEGETLAFSSDNKTLVTGSYDKTARLWNVATGALIRVFEGEGIVYGVRLLSDNVLLTSESTDVKVKLWDIESGELLNAIRAPFDQWGSIQAISHNGELLVSRPTISNVVLRSVKTGELMHTLRGHKDWARCVQFSPDDTLVISGDGQALMVWEVDTGFRRARLTSYEEQINTAAFSWDGSLIVTISTNGNAMIWNSLTGLLKQTLTGYFKDDVSVAFSPTGMFVSGSSDGPVRLWDLSSSDAKEWPSEPEISSPNIDSIRLSPDGNFAIPIARSKIIEILNTTTKAIYHTFKGHTDFIRNVIFSPNSQRLASFSEDSVVKLWNIEAKTLLHTIEGHWAGSMAFSPDSKLLASSSGWGGGISLWDVSFGQPLIVTPGPSTSGGVAFSSDSSQVACGSYEGDATIWSTLTGEVTKSFKGCSSEFRLEIHSFSHDDKFLNFVVNGREIVIWDLQTGKEYRHFKPGSVNAMAISPSSKWIATAGYGNELKLWDVQAGGCIQTFETGGRINELDFSDDDAYLTTCRGVWRVHGVDGLPVPTTQRQQLDIFAQERWLTLGGEKLLWLPDDYLAVCIAVGRDFIILGRQAGGYIFIQFDTSQLPFASSQMLAQCS